jgi:hypothetical protein
MYNARNSNRISGYPPLCYCQNFMVQAVQELAKFVEMPWSQTQFTSPRSICSADTEGTSGMGQALFFLAEY